MMWSSWRLILFLSLTGCLSEYSAAVPGLPTSYAAILRIKSASSSSALFNSKNRPRLSSPSLGSISSPGWRGTAQHYHSPTNLNHFSEAFKHDESVDYGPVFIQEPDDVIFPTDSEEKKVSLNCQARGNPAPIYRWLRNGTEIDIESDYRYSLIEGSFIINNPNEAKDSGQYQCLTTNVFGSILSREATLQFACHPRQLELDSCLGDHASAFSLYKHTTSMRPINLNPLNSDIAMALPNPVLFAPGGSISGLILYTLTCIKPVEGWSYYAQW
ncbi:unnamed protein product [Caretta caretta]